jgi:phage gp46-like protein
MNNDIRVNFENNIGDVAVRAGDLEAETGLETAVIISLFTDARDQGERGHWADALTGERTGSKLWRLEREKLTPIVARKHEEAAKEALAWMVQDNIAKSVNVTAEIQSPDRINLLIEITRPNDKVEAFRFNDIWNEQSKLR